MDYERRKKEASEKRKAAARLEKAKKDSERIENRLTEIEAECAEKEADHVALAALWQERDELEEKLLECYEIIEEAE